MKEYFFEDSLAKREFSFIGDDHSLPEGLEIDSEIKIQVKDEQGEEIIIPFRVTRNAHLSDETWWVYGEVLSVSDGKYRQIEIKLHRGKPNLDTIEVFLMAPPFFINKLH